MIPLLIISFIALAGFGAAYYQSYRDKHRWKRISSGMSLFGEREDIPPLELEDRRFDSHERRVLVIWNDFNQSSFDTVSDAKRKIEKELESHTDRSREARIFAWDGETWKQRR